MKAKGFTLIELMIVIGILGLLAASAFPTYQTFRRRAVGSEAITKMKQLLDAQIMYFLEHNEYFLGSDDRIEVYHDGRDPSLQDIEETKDTLGVTLQTGHFLDFIVNGDKKTLIIVTIAADFPIFKDGSKSISYSLDNKGKISGPL